MKVSSISRPLNYAPGFSCTKCITPSLLLPDFVTTPTLLTGSCYSSRRLFPPMGWSYIGCRALWPSIISHPRGNMRITRNPPLVAPGGQILCVTAVENQACFRTAVGDGQALPHQLPAPSPFCRLTQSYSTRVQYCTVPLEVQSLDLGNERGGSQLRWGDGLMSMTREGTCELMF